MEGVQRDGPICFSDILYGSFCAQREMENKVQHNAKGAILGGKKVKVYLGINR